MPAGRAGLALLVLLGAAPARADRFLYTAHAGGGALVRLTPTEAPRVQGQVLLESVFGVTDDFNVEVPLLIELGPPALSLGAGVEYVFFHDNHWRLDVGIGAAARYAFAGQAFGAAPYLKASVRWLFAWGLGAQLGFHALVQVAGPEPVPTFLLFPGLALYQEFW